MGRVIPCCITLALLTLPGCGVPGVVFVSDDAATPAGMDGGSGEAGSLFEPVDGAASPADGHASRDAGLLDATLLDGSLPEAAADGCPGSPPPGTVACCGTVPCVAPNAAKCRNACASCEQSCMAGLVCCIAPEGSFNGCAPSATMCH